MKSSLIVTGLFAALCAPAAFAQGEVVERVVRDQARLNQELQARFGSFASPDSLPTFAPRVPSLQRTVRLQAPSLPSVNLPSLGSNAFGLQLPSPNLRSPAASLRLDGLNPFGGSSFTASMPQFNVGSLRNLNASSLLGVVPGAQRVVGNLTGRSLFGSQREGEHSTPSLPFLDSSDAENLTYKVEAVKIIEHTLKALKDSPPGQVGGFKMMGFLVKLLKRVAKRQKGMVAGILVLITVPYAATLATTWMSGPTTAMEIIWPLAKKAIVALGMKLLRKLGRKRGDPGSTDMDELTRDAQDVVGDFRERVREIEGVPQDVLDEIDALGELEGDDRTGEEVDDDRRRRIEERGGVPRPLERVRDELPVRSGLGRSTPVLQTGRIQDTFQERAYGGSLTPRIPALR